MSNAALRSSAELDTRFDTRTGFAGSESNEPNLLSHQNNSLNSRFFGNSTNPNDNDINIENVSRIIGDIILEQIPNNGSLDSSNNLMYTFEIPYRL